MAPGRNRIDEHAHHSAANGIAAFDGFAFQIEVEHQRPSNFDGLDCELLGPGFDRSAADSAQDCAAGVDNGFRCPLCTAWSQRPSRP